MEGKTLTRSQKEERGINATQTAGKTRPGFALAPRTLLPGRPHLLLPALASGVLLWLCYFPVAWGWLAWVALVPLLALVRAEARTWRLFLCAWAGGLLFFWAALQWMRVADYRMYFTWAALATYCALYWPLAIFLLRRLDRGTSLPLVLTVPLVWTALEFLRSFLMGGFPWYFLAHTQHDYLALIQIADLGGAYLVSFLVAAAGAWLFELLYAWGPCRALLGLYGTAAPTRLRWLVTQGVCVAVLLVATGIYGGYQLTETNFREGPTVSLLQGNLDQRIRNVDPSGADAASKQALREISDHFGRLCLCARFQTVCPDLIVWPETSYTLDWMAVSPELPLEQVPERWRDEQIWTQNHFRKAAAECNTNVLIGLNTEMLVGPKERVRYNSALLMHGNGGIGERYDKIHRVPFGEFVPLRKQLPFMNAFAPYSFDYSIEPGEQFTRFKMNGKYTFGVVICYEDTDPVLARQYGREHEDGPPVDFLVNISNDGWFDGSCEHDEHLAVARFRAVEARRSLVRSVNMGISAVIDGNGRVIAPQRVSYVDPEPAVQGGQRRMRVLDPRYPQAKPESLISMWVVRQPLYGPSLPVSEWQHFKKVAGVLTAVVPIDDRMSYYSLWGDWLPGSCWAVLGVGLIWSVLRRRPAPTEQNEAPEGHVSTEVPQAGSARTSPAPWKRRLLRLVVLAGCCYLGAMIVLLALENWLVYHPTAASSNWASAPKGIEDVWLSLEDGTAIHGWWLPHPESRGAVFYLHGNAGNLSHRAGMVVHLSGKLKESVLIIDYPGYGRSSGSPSEAGCYAAADAAYNWLRTEKAVPAEGILLYGASLGGGVAVDLASRQKHRALILINTFTSMPDVGQRLYPWLPVRWLMRNRYDSLSKITQCECPVFLAHGTADTLIPYEHSERLHEAITAPKKYLPLPGIGHNDFLPDEFFHELTQFLQTAEPSTPRR